jgi:voltage-gated potassium channel
MRKKQSFRRRFAKLTAAPMFWLSLLFLANTSMLIVVWVDVPRVSENTGGETAATASAAPDAAVESGERLIADTIGGFSLRVAELMWPIFLAEFLIYVVLAGRGPQFTRTGVFSCICPPLRLAAPNPEMNGQLWLPGMGWTRPTHEVRERLERVFGLPMIIIALMILPILVLEFGFNDQINKHFWLRALLHVSTGLIWFAFALEFIVMWSLAPKKLQYCKDHWVDLAIILLPLISFLRSLRLIRATRLAKVAKVQQLSKMSRVYRLRGLVVRTLRALFLFEVLHRVFGISPERRIRALREKLEEKEREVAALKRQIESLEQIIAAAEIAENTGMAFSGEDLAQ